MIYCFVIDTNPSMGEIQQSMSSLDLCKCAIEQFLLKMRGNQSQSLEKSLMLIKSGNDSSCSLSTLGDAYTTFERAMKNIQPSRENHPLSYSITMTLSLLNKYRMKSGVDHFGKGLMPWQLEPATIFILTNGLSSIRDNDVPILSNDSGGELYTSCLRWDHKIVSYIVNSSGKHPDSYLNTSLSRLSLFSGGETHVVSGLKQTIYDLAARFATFSPPSVTVDVSLLSLSNSSENSITTKVFSDLVASLAVSHPGEWPIPEAQWLDRSVDSLAKRPARPHLQIIVKEGDIPGPSYTSEQLHNMITVARNTGLQPDCYSLSIIATNYKKRTLRLFQKSQGEENEISPLLSSIANTNDKSNVGNKDENINNNSSNFTSDRLSDGCLGYQCCGVRLVVDPKEISNPSLFGILCPNSDGKRSDLLIFPYNFPQLLPLLQQAKDICSRIGGPANLSIVANSPNSLPQSWQLQLSAYLRSVPPYYYPSLYKTFKSLGLHVFFSLLIGSATSSPPPPDLSLSRPCMRQLAQVAQKAKADLCLIDPTEALVDNTISLTTPGINTAVSSIDGTNIDSSLLEYNTMNNRGPISLQRSLHWKNPSSLLALGITSSTHRSHTTVSLYHPVIPHINGHPPASQDLLYTWEKIRSAVYGGTGLTVRGLYVAGLVGSSSGSYIDNGSQHQPDWFFKACGGATVPRLSVSGMSDYVSILSKNEVLRDPELINPPQDEDQAQGILKRKLAVNFGSPYKSIRKGAGNKPSKAMISDETALEYRDGVTGTDDIFNISSPDQNNDSNTNEAFIAFSAPSSPLIISDHEREEDEAVALTVSVAQEEKKRKLNSSLEIESISPQYQQFKSESEMKTIPKLKLKGKKVSRIPPNLPRSTTTLSSLNTKTQPSTTDVDPVESQAGNQQAPPSQGSKNQSGIAFTAPWMSPTSSQPSTPTIPIASVAALSTSSKSTPTPLSSSSLASPAPALVPAPSPAVPAIPASTSSTPPPPLPPPPTPVEQLPSGWIKRFSEKHKCVYWFNTVTGVSQWTPPTEESTTI